jgi:hypothetical protein
VVAGRSVASAVGVAAGVLLGRWWRAGWDFADEWVGAGPPEVVAVGADAGAWVAGVAVGGEEGWRVGEGVGDDGVGGGGALAWAAGVTPGGALLSPPCQERAT